MQETIIERLSKLEGVITDFSDVIENEADDFRKDCGIITAEAMRTHFAGLEEENRLLNIGIVGRVNAGKSSLLNAIFFNGDSILPKAATPMTASLSVMTYGDTFSATVEYFTKQDIEEIKKEHAAYRVEWDRKYGEIEAEVKERAKKRGESPDLEKARKRTDTAMKESKNNASHDQYERMMKAGAAPSGESQSLSAGSLPDLLGKLNEYVGSSGRMMPYTKSVEIRIPTDALRDICVVDTPGINDPVKSREARTEEYLKECDVVFIVSPAGQFISVEDTALMDRLSAKEGVQELYLVASQSDNQLYGSIGDETGFDLNKAAEKVRSDLSSQAATTLSNLKANSPEVAGQFDKLISGGSDRVLITSAMCHSMRLKYDNRGSWDVETKHAWELLNDKYRDYFDNDNTAKASLELLSGVGKVSGKIELARQEKDRIIAQKQADYVSQQVTKIDRFSRELAAAVKHKLDEVQNADIALIREKKKNIETLKARATEAVDGTYKDCLDVFKTEIRGIIAEKSKTLFMETGNSTEGFVKLTTRQGKKNTHVPRSFLGFTWTKKVVVDATFEVRTLRTGAITSKLNELVSGLQDLLNETVENEKRNWRQTVQSKVVGALREAIDDNDLIDPFNLKAVIRQAVNNMELPDLDLDSERFHSSGSGIIEGDEEVDRFLGEVDDNLSDLKRIFNKKRDEFLSAVEKSARREKMSTMLFSKFGEQLENLERDIQNKELTLDRLKKCDDALAKVSRTEA